LLKSRNFKFELVWKIDVPGKPDLCSGRGQIAYRAGDIRLLVPSRDPSFQNGGNALGSTTVLHLGASSIESDTAPTRIMAEPPFGSPNEGA
jgi:hypothetical protein